jgi:hypothetical protein
MQEYDAALKLLLQASADSVLRQVTGGIRVTRWLKTEFQQCKRDALTCWERLPRATLFTSFTSNFAVAPSNKIKTAKTTEV